MEYRFKDLYSQTFYNTQLHQVGVLVGDTSFVWKLCFRADVQVYSIRKWSYLMKHHSANYIMNMECLCRAGLNSLACQFWPTARMFDTIVLMYKKKSCYTKINWKSKNTIQEIVLQKFIFKFLVAEINPWLILPFQPILII